MSLTWGNQNDDKRGTLVLAVNPEREKCDSLRESDARQFS
jgi:hypothetical protein